MHGWFAIAFFAFILSVAIFDSRSTLREVYDPVRQRRYRIAYVVTSILLFVLPLGAAVAHYYLGRADTRTYWLELAAIYAFAVYWSIKSWELRTSLAQRPRLQEAVSQSNE